MKQRWEVILSGVVQGIGLRPLIYRLSKKHHLTGWVQNTEQNVTLEWQGLSNQLEQAIKELQLDTELVGKIYFSHKPKPLKNESHFRILPSIGNGTTNTLISPDISICQHCLHELFDPHNRRYQYPFITCAQCGPRYTLCEQLPFDRHHTTMSKFSLCSTCQAEYTQPSNKRFHAQTISCWKCGPHLWLWDRKGNIIAEQQNAIKITIEALQRGKILAIKGIGGFHLMAIASNTTALNTLRTKKNRPDKPFALMVKDLPQAMEICYIPELAKKLLTSPASPIVLLKKKQTAYSISEMVAPNQSYYGIMLAYTPLHYLLMSHVHFPLIATSANIKDEPICFQNHEALSELNDIADLWLCHDRDIFNPLEDSIVQLVNGKMQFIRRARGFIPFAFPASYSLQPLLAVGGHLKNSIALHYQNNIFVSPFIGDLSSVKSVDRFQQQLTRFLKIAPRSTMICDCHPEYASSQEAKRLQPDAYSIQHHKAHVFAVMAEHQLSSDILGFAWDGMGLGDDGTLWGGETFLIHSHQIAHVATLYPFSLLGNNTAIKEPRRIAISMLYELFGEQFWQYVPPYLKVFFTEIEQSLLPELIRNTSQNLQCTSMGRIFDGISFLLGGIPKMTFEGQAAMYIEQLVIHHTKQKHVYPVELLKQKGKMIIDWRPMLRMLLHDLSQGIGIAQIAQQFHYWCSDTIYMVSRKFIPKKIVLSGGVFQNKLLTELASNTLQKKGYKVYSAVQLPPNDGGLAIGQIYAMNYLLSS